MEKFNIRVYGILINEKREVLVSDELIRGERYTKFPGGGLEIGEGTRDCLAREFLEELNLKIEVRDHLYTTDFYQVSAFNPAHQIISIYYLVKALEPIQAKISITEFDFEPSNEPGKELIAFRFISWEELSEENVSLPIDKIVVGLIKAGFKPVDLFP